MGLESPSTVQDAPTKLVAQNPFARIHGQAR